MQNNPQRYLELARYRGNIQMANRKFEIYPTLYIPNATIVASALKKMPFNVNRCPFLASDTLEENKNQNSIRTRAKKGVIGVSKKHLQTRV